MNFRTKMIRIKGHRLSEAYAAYCLPSWDGIDVEMFDAVTEENIYDTDIFWDFNFVLATTVGMNRQLAKSNTWYGISKREAACYVSFITLWLECIKENIPYLILEHDALLVGRIDQVVMDPNMIVKKISNHANVATFYTPEFCKKLINDLLYRPDRIHTGPFEDIVKHAPYIMDHDYNLVMPVFDPDVGTTIPEHFSTHEAKGHKVINLNPKKSPSFPEGLVQ